LKHRAARCTKHETQPFTTLALCLGKADEYLRLPLFARIYQLPPLQQLIHSLALHNRPHLCALGPPLCARQRTAHPFCKRFLIQITFCQNQRSRLPRRHRVYTQNTPFIKRRSTCSQPANHVRPALWPCRNATLASRINAHRLALGRVCHHARRVVQRRHHRRNCNLAPRRRYARNRNSAHPPSVNIPSRRRSWPASTSLRQADITSGKHPHQHSSAMR